MSDPLGLQRDRLNPLESTVAEYVLVHRPLRRVLSFLGRSIHDVCNDPIVKNQVYGYYKLHKHIHRASEIYDLERQWNAL